MLMLVLTILLTLGVAIYALSRPPARLEQRWPPLALLLILALTPLALWAGLHLFFGVAESLGGDISVGHLATALPLILLMYLMWRQPLPSGIALVIVGISGLIEASLAANGPPRWLITVIYLVPGLLLLGGAAMAHRQHPRPASP
jgi:hypothetical protein